ncbi:hypothetical protein D9M69_607360 [compost metagenome]
MRCGRAAPAGGWLASVKLLHAPSWALVSLSLSFSAARRLARCSFMRSMRWAGSMRLCCALGAAVASAGAVAAVGAAVDGAVAAGA